MILEVTRCYFAGGGRPNPAPREPLPRLLLSPSASLPFLPSLPFAGVRWGSGVSPARSEALTSGSVVLGHGSGRPRAGGRLTPPGLGCHQRWWWAAGAPCCAPWGGAAAAGACPLLCRRSSLPMCLVVACRTSSGLAPRSSELSTGLGRRRRPPPLLLYRQAEAHATRFACPAGRVRTASGGYFGCLSPQLHRQAEARSRVLLAGSSCGEHMPVIGAAPPSYQAAPSSQVAELLLDKLNSVALGWQCFHC